MVVEEEGAITVVMDDEDVAVLFAAMLWLLLLEPVARALVPELAAELVEWLTPLVVGDVSFEEGSPASTAHPTLGAIRQKVTIRIANRGMMY